MQPVHETHTHIRKANESDFSNKKNHCPHKMQTIQIKKYKFKRTSKKKQQ